MKKYIYIFLILVITLNFSTSYGEDISLNKNISLSAKSSILIDADTGRIIYEKNAHEKMPIASTTKIMTALIALEKGNLDDKVKVADESIGVEGSSIYLKPGELITLKDLIYGLMLRSGNDSAVAIAFHIGGSTEEFVRLMNDKAKSIGALNTNFTNPNGLHDENHYSTAYNMALITKEAFKKDEFSNIVKSKSYVSEREENNYFYNKNKTLLEYDGGSGVKTGYTMKSGRCLVSSASRNGMNLIAVSLNASDWFNDNYKLLDYGFNNYKSSLIYDKGQYLKKLTINDGDREYLDLVTEKGFFYPLKEGEREKIKISIETPDEIQLPIDKGQKIGYISIYLDNQLIDKSNLIAKTSINKKSIIKRLFNKISHK